MAREPFGMDLWRYQDYKIQQEVYRKAKAFDEIELTVTQPATELQITKDSSIQAIPLSNEAYEKAVKGERD
jgi:hypothetical protein